MLDFCMEKLARSGLKHKFLNQFVRASKSVFIRPVFWLRDRCFQKFQKCLTVYYSIDLCPYSFDFCYFLMACDLERRRQGLEKMRIVIYAKQRHPSEDYGVKVDRDWVGWRFENLVLPLIHLFPTVQGHCIVSNWLDSILSLPFSCRVFPFHPLFPKKYTFEKHHRSVLKELEEPYSSFGIRVSETAKGFIKKWIENHAKGKKLVVITIRNSPFDSKRNSKLKEWRRFIDANQGRGFAFVVVNDTDIALERLPEELIGLTLFNEAAWSIAVRAALYECAFLNLTISLGPAALCYFNNKCRMIMFKMSIEGVPIAERSRMEEIGFKYNQQLPWHDRFPFQKIVWEDDDYEVIQREFDLLCSQIDETSSLCSVN